MKITLALLLMLVALILFILNCFDVHPRCLAVAWVFFCGAFVAELWR